MKKPDTRKPTKSDADPGKKVISEEQYSDDASFFDDEHNDPEIVDEEGIGELDEQDEDQD